MAVKSQAARGSSLGRAGRRASPGVCSACKAVWFDAGELERVVVENRKKFVATFPTTRPNVTPASTLSFDALGSLVETMGAIIFERW